MWARHSDSQRGSPRRGERARWQLPLSEGRGAPLTGCGKVDELWLWFEPSSATNYLEILGKLLSPPLSLEFVICDMGRDAAATSWSVVEMPRNNL